MSAELRYVSDGITQTVLKALHDQSLWRGPTSRELADALPYSQGAIHRALVKLESEGYIDEKWRPIHLIEREKHGRS